MRAVAFVLAAIATAVVAIAVGLAVGLKWVAPLGVGAQENVRTAEEMGLPCLEDYARGLQP